MEKAQNLLKQLLLGLESALKSALGELLEIASEKFEMTTDLNVKKIQLKCSEVQQKVEVRKILSVSIQINYTILVCVF